MKYYQSKTISGVSFQQAREQVVEALQKEGFGVLSEIDIQATMKKKLNKDYLPHLILGACNPAFADRALQQEPTISTLLPCNVTLRELENGSIEVAVIDPIAALGIVNNKQIEPLAAEVKDRLERTLAAIG